jgi:hypothetical protein
MTQSVHSHTLCRETGNPSVHCGLVLQVYKKLTVNVVFLRAVNVNCAINVLCG